MKKKYSPAGISAGLVFLLFAGGCSAKGMAAGAADYQYSKSSLEAEYSLENSAAEEAVYADAAAPEPAGEGTEAGTLRKLVKRAYISIRTEDLTRADTAVSALMAQYGAYASSANVNENFRQYTIRVPAPSYTALLAGLDGMGRLLSRSESADDVSLRYYDLEGRLSTKRELLKTFQSYLGKAKNIEEILAVEERLAELEDEIDGTGKELRSLANLVDYATVELEIRGPVTSPAYSRPTLGERIAGLFGSFGEFASAALVALLGIIIYGLPCLLALTLLFYILFGRIGLIKKLWRLAAGKKNPAPETGRIKNKNTKDQVQE
jgi:hypothetical protein